MAILISVISVGTLLKTSKRLRIIKSLNVMHGGNGDLQEIINVVKKHEERGMFK